MTDPLSVNFSKVFQSLQKIQCHLLFEFNVLFFLSIYLQICLLYHKNSKSINLTIQQQKRSWLNIGFLLANFLHLLLNRLQVLKYNRSVLLLFHLFCYFFSAWRSVCTTVTLVTYNWLIKFVNKVGSTVLDKNVFEVFAIVVLFATKADLPVNFTIFHCRMSTIQPAWPDCTTSECWHTCCWHFCSCSSHKTIPSLREFFVTKKWSRFRRFVIFVSIGFTQVYVMKARIGYKEKWSF